MTAAPTPSNEATQSWTPGAKDLVMTGLGSSRVWATMAHGIFNEIYWPTVDQPEVKDFGFLVGDGDRLWREVKQVNNYTLTVADAAVALPTVVHSATNPDYELTLKVVVDPDRDCVLIEYELTPDGVRLYPLLAPHLCISQPPPNDDSAQAWIAALGADNVASYDASSGALFAAGSGRCLCLLATPGFSRASCGHVGDTDGWTDFDHNKKMTLTYDQAGPGVVAVMGECSAGSGLLALSFGDSPAASLAIARATTAAGYDATAAAFSAGWGSWTASLNLPEPVGAPSDLPDALRQSATVLRTHADHTRIGAYVAGLAIPWGADTNDPGGYHMIWCRDGVETAMALAAVGHHDDAAALLGCLAGLQDQHDGSWARCYFVDGASMPGAVQPDEVALPIMLAGKLAELGAPWPTGVDTMVAKAAAYLAQNGPASPNAIDRWEEAHGASPFAVGVSICALVVAAATLNGADKAMALALADNWYERIEELTYVQHSDLDDYFRTDGHYVRVGSLGTTVSIGNQPTPLDLPGEAVVGMEFLYLARLGLRDPANKRLTDTLTIVEKLIGFDTPASPGAASHRTYYRYDADGYGEWTDGSGWPQRHFGIGRPWPLLAGERGHYERLRDGTGLTQLEDLLGMRGRGGLLPEQIWDADWRPWRDLIPGKPSGSAMPLAWAHSELIKLAATVLTGRPVEMLTAVTDRYPADLPTAARWYWLDALPPTSVPGGRDLVITSNRSFSLHFGFDDPSDWQNVSDRTAHPAGLGLYEATLTSGELAPHELVGFVRHYVDGTWDEAPSYLRVGGPVPPAIPNTTR